MTSDMPVQLPTTPTDGSAAAETEISPAVLGREKPSIANTDRNKRDREEWTYRQGII